MKICCIASSLFSASEDSYGSESQTMQLADALGDLDHEVILFAAPQTPEGNYDLKLMPSSHGLVSYETECFSYDEYRDLLLSCDYIIDQSATVKTLEEIYFWDRDWLEDHTAIFARNGCEFGHPRPPVNSKLHGVALSKAAKEIAVKKWKLPEELIHIISYGIDADIYSPRSEKNEYVLYLGAARKEKGIMTILDIAEKMPDECFILAWRAQTEEHKGTEREFLAALEKRELENVEFRELPEKDQTDAKVELYQKAKVFLQPTSPNYIEAWGLTTAEALSCATPVITARHGAHPELIEEGETGFLCNTIEQYVEAIGKIEQIAPAKCREYILQNHTEERYSEDYLELYREIS